MILIISSAVPTEKVLVCLAVFVGIEVDTGICTGELYLTGKRIIFAFAEFKTFDLSSPPVSSDINIVVGDRNFLTIGREFNIRRCIFICVSADNIGCVSTVLGVEHYVVKQFAVFCGIISLCQLICCGCGQAEHCREHQRTEKNRDDLLHGNSPFFLSVQDRFINKYYTISYCIKQHRTAPCTAN